MTKHEADERGGRLLGALAELRGFMDLSARDRAVVMEALARKSKLPEMIHGIEKGLNMTAEAIRERANVVEQAVVDFLKTLSTM